MWGVAINRGWATSGVSPGGSAKKTFKAAPPT